MGALRTATTALDRFRDHKVAVAEGYIHHDGDQEDSFMMGEHWIDMELIGAGLCELTRPTHLQYLRIDGRRTLIGTGYFCFPSAPGEPPPGWFGADVEWHSHGPQFCHGRDGRLWLEVLPFQMQAVARALPSPLNPLTWEELCRTRHGGEPLERQVFMLHAWNWIPHPYGPLVHENPAIPFLRAGLAVPTRETLDSERGRAALATLRLAYRGFTQYGLANLQVQANREQRRAQRGIIRAAVQRGEAAVNAMRRAEARQDDEAYFSNAKSGASALTKMRADIGGLFSVEQRTLIDQSLAEERIHHYPGHHTAH